MKSLQVIVSFFIIASICRGIEGQAFIVTEGGQNIKLGLVTVGIYTRKTVESFYAKKASTVRSLLKTNESKVKEFTKDGKNEEIVPLLEENLFILQSFFSDFPTDEAIVKTKTDADGRFKINYDKKDDVLLVAWFIRRVGRLFESYSWVLPPDEWDNPLFLSNDNQFDGATDSALVVFTGDKKKRSAQKTR